MISIIVPIYNTEKYLEECLTSIANQTYSDLEVIMVNDGSEDTSGKIAASFAEKDQRFVLINQDNRGVSVARNTGLNFAHGDYVLFIDSDDKVDLKMAETLLNNCLERDADISCCQSDYGFCRDLNKMESWNRDQVIREFLTHRRINGQLANKLIERSLIGGTRFNINIKYGEDALFFWEIIKNCRKMCVTDQIMYYRTLHDDSASGGGFKPIRMQSHIVWEQISRDAKKMGSVYYSLARAQLGKMAFDTWLMMIASHYENLEYTRECVVLVRQNIGPMLSAKFIKPKMKLLAVACMFFSTAVSAVISKVW